MCRFRAEITMANSKKKCRHCKAFALVETGVTVPLGFYCTKEHALEHQQAKAIASVSKIRAKATQLAKKDIKARKQALKSLGELHKEAQPEFNKYIRLRDKGKALHKLSTTPHRPDTRRALQIGRGSSRITLQREQRPRPMCAL